VGEPSGRINIAVHLDALKLAYAWRPPGSTVWTRGTQRIRLAWTPCHFGGARTWVRCGRCGRRAAKLYLGGDDAAFACRLCYDLGYASQGKNPRHRAIAQARRLRVRIGGSMNLLDPPPRRPGRMHRRTYYRLLDKVIAAQERVIAFDLEGLRMRGFLGETGIES
jgi:hypothetical protein